jgi:hypothetical protein
MTITPRRALSLAALSLGASARRVKAAGVEKE